MKRIETEQAKVLGLEPDDGGWKPAEGRKIYLRVRSGGSSTAIDDVTRIVTDDEGWFVWCDEGQEVIWLSPKSILYLGSKAEEGHRGTRAGFI